MLVNHDEMLPTNARDVIGGGNEDLLENGDLAAETDSEAQLQATLSAGGLARVIDYIPTQSHSETNPDRSHEVFQFTYDSARREAVISSDVTREDYEKITHPDDLKLIEDLSERLQGKRFVFINSTKAGGGVVMLRPPIVHGAREYGIDGHWFIMDDPNEEELGGNPFLVTKKIHNTLQRRLAPDEFVTPAEVDLHEAYALPEGEVLAEQPEIKNADVIVIDDPQPTPTFWRLKQANPKAKFVFRYHIDLDGQLMSDPTTPQGEISERILKKYGLEQADAFVYHPVEQFVVPSTADKSYFAPATTEPHDDLNRELNPDEIQAGFDFINDEIALKNATLPPERQIPLMDPNKKRILLVARFDESKGMDHAMEMGARVRRTMRAQGIPEEELPEVVIIGNGSIDDPSGGPMYEKMSQLRLDEYADEAPGIILMRLKHNYTAMNAIMRKSHVLMQTSTQEGCETRISDGIEHGLPAVVFNNGGMPAQVIEGKSGYILDYSQPNHDIERGAALITELMMNPDKHAALVQTTHEYAQLHNRRNYTTMANLARWLRIFDNVLAGRPADHLWLMQDLVAQHRAE